MENKDLLLGFYGRVLFVVCFHPVAFSQPPAVYEILETTPEIRAGRRRERRVPSVAMGTLQGCYQER